jgi:hypothetical protein
MEVKDIHHYDHDVNSVFRFFHDPATVKTKYETIGARNVEILDTSEDGSAFTIKIQREVPADVPGILQKFLGAWNKVIQTEHWQTTADGGRNCNLNVDIAGVPVTVTGTMALQSQGDGCVNDVRMKVTCGIPLVGKKLAEFVAGDTKKAMDSEYAYIKSHLV